MDTQIEQIRTPIRFRQRVSTQFISKENIKYLRGLFLKKLAPDKMRQFILDNLDSDVRDFGSIGQTGTGGELLDSDDISRRGFATGGVSIWDEVKRLNMAF